MIKTKGGDIFLTTHPGIGLGKCITWAQAKLLSKDHKARYSHAAHFTRPGFLLDTGWFVEYRSIKNYTGHQCTIYRPVEIPSSYIMEADKVIRQDLGQRYPWQRLILHFLGLADNIHWNRLVCSEREAKFLHLIYRRIGCFDFEHYYGITPDWLDDYCRSSKRFETIFEGVL